MALQSTGAISLNDVQTEFGGSNPIGIDEYYRGGSNVPDTPANSSIPTSGTIAMDDFYGGDSTPAGGGGPATYTWSNYAYGATIGTLIVYWLNNATSTLTTLRTISGQQHTSTGQPWDVYTEDLSPFNGQTGKIVYRYQGGGSFTGDIQIDNMSLTNGTTTTDLKPETARTNLLWQQQTRGTSVYSATSFSTVPTGSSTTYGWQYDAAGTPSGSTGNTVDADGSSSGYYAYVETSSSNGTTSYYHWFRTTNDYTITSGSPPPPPPATYTFTTTPTSIDEGSSGTFAITTTNVPNSTTLYWTTSHVTSAAADFTANSGSFTITSNSGTFAVSVAEDTLTETTEYFRIQIRTGSSSGPVVATSNQIGINDIAPPPGYTWTTTSFSPNSYDGGTTINITTLDASTATTSTVTVGSGNQTFPFTYTITNFVSSGNYVNKILVLRNGTTIVDHTATSSTGTFSFTTSSTLNQIAFRTTVVAEDTDPDIGFPGPISTMNIYYNGTTLVWTHSYRNDWNEVS